MRSGSSCSIGSLPSSFAALPTQPPHLKGRSLVTAQNNDCHSFRVVIDLGLCIDAGCLRTLHSHCCVMLGRQDKGPVGCCLAWGVS